MNKLEEVLRSIPGWKRRYNRKYQLAAVRRMNQLIERSDLSQKEIAERAEWSEAYVSRILSGRQNLTLKTLARLEEALGEDVVRVTSDEKYPADMQPIGTWFIPGNLEGWDAFVRATAPKEYSSGCTLTFRPAEATSFAELEDDLA